MTPTDRERAEKTAMAWQDLYWLSDRTTACGALTDRIAAEFAAIRREALEAAAAAIGNDGENHGGGAHDHDCLICESIAAIRALIDKPEDRR